MSKPEFVYVTYIETTPEKLWHALTDGDFTERYWFGHRIASDWKVGSPYRFTHPSRPSPQGKVLTDMMLWEKDGAVVIEADPARGADLLRRLTMYKLRSDVALADVTEALGVAFAEAPFPGATPDPRRAELGFRKIVSRSELADAADGPAVASVAS